MIIMDCKQGTFISFRETKKRGGLNKETASQWDFTQLSLINQDFVFAGGEIFNM